MADHAPILRSIIEDYIRRSGIDLKPTHTVKHLSMAMPLVASTQGRTLRARLSLADVVPLPNDQRGAAEQHK